MHHCSDHSTITSISHTIQSFNN